MERCPPRGRGKRRFATRTSGCISHLTISLLLAFQASCEKPQPSNSGVPPSPPVVAFLQQKDLEKERTELKIWHSKIEEAGKLNSINESQYKASIKKYEERMRENEVHLEKLKPRN
jgi:hypothetical protein